MRMRPIIITGICHLQRFTEIVAAVLQADEAYLGLAKTG